MESNLAQTTNPESRFKVVPTNSPGADAPNHTADSPSGRQPDTPSKSESHSRFLVLPADGLNQDDSESRHDSPELDSPTEMHHNTHEALPTLRHYMKSGDDTAKPRPTLRELHEDFAEQSSETESSGDNDYVLSIVQNNHPTQLDDANPDGDNRAGAPRKTTGLKFGWIQGVLIRCLLNIWGVMLFLRLSWVVGQAGVGWASVIVLLSAVVTTLTALSLSAICTNGVIRGGGAYYLISRSLGPGFGGAIGIVFSLANAIAVAMYVVGFAETVRDVMQERGVEIVDSVNDVRIVGALTIIVLFFIAVIGMEWESRAQFVLLGILILAIFDFVIGSFLPPTLEKESKGFVGYSGAVFVENFGPSYHHGEDFFSVFSIFFPAATGILAGANISGDLKDPQVSIPKGTLLAIVLSSIVYLLLAWMVGACAIRDASGVISFNMTAAAVLTSTISGTESSIGASLSNSTLTEGVRYIADCDLGSCDYGLVNNFGAVELISLFGPLVLAGIFSASLSSALASLVGAPKVFQAVCKDNIFPKIDFFAKGYGKNDEPIRAYILTFFIALGFIAIGELNAIAPIISNFFLMCYALINGSCFCASLSNSPGWRPAFKFYHMWCALIACIICIAVMFIINWWTALLTIAVIAVLYGYVTHQEPNVNWGTSTQALLYLSTLKSIIKLNSHQSHTKNFRPQCLVLAGQPNNRPALVYLVSHFTKNISLMICGHVLTDQKRYARHQLLSTGEKWLVKHNIKAFYSAVVAQSLRAGAHSLMQSCGIGKVRPNLVIMGFKSNWTEDAPDKVIDYVGIIHDAFVLNYAVGILRVHERLDRSMKLKDGKMLEEETCVDDLVSSDMPSEDGLAKAGAGGAKAEPTVDFGDLGPVGIIRLTSRVIDSSTQVIRGGEAVIRNPGVIKMIDPNRFRHKQPKGYIDVYWLFDDGGLTLLVPHLLSLNSRWEGCKLRVFVTGSTGKIDEDKLKMARLLSQLRIEYHDLYILSESNKPAPASIKLFYDMIDKYRLKENELASDYPWKISREEIDSLSDKTLRQIRMGELLQEHSNNATMILITLPMPRKGTCSSYMFMAWMETISRNLPPVLLLRGNQESVLTFYT